MVSVVLLTLCLSAKAEPPPAPLEGQTMTLIVGHHFSRDDARARLGQLLEYWKKRFEVLQQWTSDNDVVVSGMVYGVPFRAFLQVNETYVRCESSDPGSLLRNRARDYVKKKLQKYLHPQYVEP